MFVRNCWYVIAWDHEVPAGRPLQPAPCSARRSCSYRTAGGEITALRDRCCHRLAPLSKGRKEGDCVRCGYHGLLFDATGRCIEIPGSETRAGEGAGAALSAGGEEQVGVRLDGRPGAGRPGAPARQLLAATTRTGTTCRGYLHYSTPQQLICDNLLDFSHLSYVHEKTLGGTTAIAQARAEIENGAARHPVTRKVHDVPPPPYYRAVRAAPGNLDRWFIYDFVLPGTLLMHSGGRPGRRRRKAT